MNLFTALDVNSSGLTAQRKRAEIAASNLANAQTTRTPEGGPYRRKDVIFQTAGFADSLATALEPNVEGVKVSDVVEDPRPFDRRFEPGHPDADADGYVTYPNVNVMEEMASLVEASESYQANIGAISILKTMINRTFDLGK